MGRYQDKMRVGALLSPSRGGRGAGVPADEPRVSRGTLPESTSHQITAGAFAWLFQERHRPGGELGLLHDRDGRRAAASVVPITLAERRPPFHGPGPASVPATTPSAGGAALCLKNTPQRYLS